jgi:hypothetical protein
VSNAVARLVVLVGGRCVNPLLGEEQESGNGEDRSSDEQHFVPAALMRNERSDDPHKTGSYGDC